MILSKFLSILCVLWIASCAGGQSARSGQEMVSSCKHVGAREPMVGSAYRGVVRNEDYDLTVRVPAGLSGWSGVGQSAPFHGFTVFLDSSQSSCIVFEVHLRVDENEAPPRPADAKPVSLGRARGWQTSRTGVVGKASILNVITTFSFDRPDQTDDGMVLLIAPSMEPKRALTVYGEFLRDLRFGK